MKKQLRVVGKSSRALRRQAIRETATWLSANINNPQACWPRKPLCAARLGTETMGSNAPTVYAA